MALVNVAWIVVLASLALCFPTVRTMLDAVRRNVKEDRRGDLRRLAVDLLTPDKHETLVQKVGDYLDSAYCHNKLYFLRLVFALLIVLGWFALMFTGMGYLLDIRIQSIGQGAAILAFAPKTSYVIAFALVFIYFTMTVVAAFVTECISELVFTVYPK